MEWALWSVVIIIGVAALLFVAEESVLRVAMARKPIEGVNPRRRWSVWNPYQKELGEGQEWLKTHAEEKHLEITSFDGLKLRALYVPAPPGEVKGVVLAFHGFQSLANVDFAPEARFFHELGYHLILPWQRSHGESEGKFITYGAKERFDCRDWARYAQKQFGKGTDLFLAGISMGAAAVLMSTALGLPENVRGLIADCGFTSPYDILSHVTKRCLHLPAFPVVNLISLMARYRAGFELKDADAREALAQCRVPVLFFHGEEDGFVPPTMTLENYRACQAEKELLLIEGAVHAQSFTRGMTQCTEKIRAFMNRCAGGIEQ